jgi:putative N6-adenine-specific DNA methylase
MYRGLAICSPGGEEVTANEISEIIKAKNTQKKANVVSFEFSDLLDLCALCYRAQSIKKIILSMAEFRIFKSLDDTSDEFKKAFEMIEFTNWLSKSKSFRVECERTGDHDYTSVDIATELAGHLLDFLEKKHNLSLKTDFDNPGISFFLYITGSIGYFGIDFSGIDLSKRQYKIFNHPESLKGTTGYHLIRESGYNSRKSLLDPFMGSGIILIEAGIFGSKFPVQYYNKEKLLFMNFDFFKEYGIEKFFKEQESKITVEKLEIYGFDYQLKYLKSTQKNAKLAGIDKQINLSKCEIEWLDTKMDKKSVDCIVTDPPRPSKHKEDKNLVKVYSELFYQADYVLKKNGCVVLLTKEDKLLVESAKKHKFKLKNKYEIMQGKEAYLVLNFVRE